MYSPANAIAEISLFAYTQCNTVPSRSGLTGWSSRHQQALLVGSLRASHSGAAYRGR